jgi:superkiller protein 3
MGLLRAARALGPATALCADIAEQYPQAAWAQRQLAALLLAQGDAEGAIAALQAAIRADGAHAAAWERLGAAYQALGRLSAALKARSPPPDACKPLAHSSPVTALLCSHLHCKQL